MALPAGTYDVRFRQNGVLRATGTLILSTSGEPGESPTSGVFNVAKGAAARLLKGPGVALVVLLLKGHEPENELRDRDTIAQVLAQPENVEADFTNYARKTGFGTVTVHDDTDRVSIRSPDPVWMAAGGEVDNTLAKLIVAVQTGEDDTTMVPLTFHTFQVNTDGNALAASFPPDGFYLTQ